MAAIHSQFQPASFGPQSGLTPPDDDVRTQIEQNTAVGGQGGTDFIAIGKEEEIVSAISVWTTSHYGNGVLRGLKVTFSYGPTTRTVMFGTEGDDSEGDRLATYNFRRGETIQNMVITASIPTATISSHCENISFRTNKGGEFFAGGGPAGSPVDQKLGNGVLIGFTGRGGFALDALGAIFGKCP